MGKHYCIVNQERLHQLYSYDPVTGLFTSNRLGVVVGGLHNGYLSLELHDNGVLRRFPIHRLVWMYVNGKWPNNFIDHINGIKTDNRICNLRDVTSKQNTENRKTYATKSGLPRSGFKGVHWARNARKWVASIGHNNKLIYLGSFDDPLEAYKRYREKAIELHTHNEFAKDVDSLVDPSWKYGGDRFLLTI